MDLISGLQQMGLTEYEAKIYAALVKQPSITGYEASKLSGGCHEPKYTKPLSHWCEKKAAYSLSVDGKQYYTPISHHSLIARFQDELLDLTTYLSVELDRLSKGGQKTFSVVTGYDLVTETAERMCARSQRRLYISVFAEDLPPAWLAKSQKRNRGASKFSPSFTGEGKGIVEDAVEHYVSPPSNTCKQRCMADGWAL